MEPQFQHVFFIDAYNEFLKETKTNKLTEENITKIVELTNKLKVFFYKFLN
ncbi:N-6 DNA methylase [Mycoplasmopsis arginini]|uniref:N-6 DNA methylase n=1 Tax=Mycoplasmopsis arginini TaxID=2094 RepID=UPI00249DF56F|nr:N-6 DNA methylase [Mycoplasmopsis arginini]